MRGRIRTAVDIDIVTTPRHRPQVEILLLVSHGHTACEYQDTWWSQPQYESAHAAKGSSIKKDPAEQDDEHAQPRADAQVAPAGIRRAP